MPFVAVAVSMATLGLACSSTPAGAPGREGTGTTPAQAAVRMAVAARKAGAAAPVAASGILRATDAASGSSGRPVLCDANAACVQLGAPVCLVLTGNCVGCLASSDCTDPNASLCGPTSHRCLE